MKNATPEVPQQPDTHEIPTRPTENPPLPAPPPISVPKQEPVPPETPTQIPPAQPKEVSAKVR